MLKITFGLLVGVLAWGAAFSNVVCPDGNVCSDSSTCCKTTQGYGCCPYVKAVCCSDLRHCCPSGFRCNLVTQMCQKKDQPWLNIPMVKKEAAEEPDTVDLSLTPFQEIKDSPVPERQDASVFCDSYYKCPDGTTCCRHPKGAWFCCPYSPGRCCLDGYHCCPYGYDCDFSYQHCVRENLWYPFTPKQAPSSVPASLISTSEDQSSKTPMTALTEALSNGPEGGVIRCDSKFYCSPGHTCCRGTSGQWNCCPFPLGQCCSDGRHCCEYGYACDPSASSCRKWFSQIPSAEQQQAKAD
ncbi:progranulin-like [Salarias fasciatus]|nr:progranulin-like [Salarias fasciatus]